jgi:hypothetical protein
LRPVIGQEREVPHSWYCLTGSVAFLTHQSRWYNHKGWIVEIGIHQKTLHMFQRDQ